MKTLGAGPEGVLLPGEEYDVSDSAGEALVQGGYAEVVAADHLILTPPLEIETAMLEPPEAAVLPSPAPKIKRQRVVVPQAKGKPRKRP